MDMRPLWDTLQQLASSNVVDQSPWIVLGDFNQVLSSNEMYLTFPFVVPILGLVEFQDCVEATRLTDIVRRGCFYT